MANANKRQPTLETIPTPTFEKILSYLCTDGLAILHVTSTTLFARCSIYIKHGKAKSEQEAIESLRFTQLDQTGDPKQLVQEEGNLKGQWDWIQVRKKRQYPLYHCICLNIEKLDKYEMARLISFYKDTMEYLIFVKRNAKFCYRPIVGVKLGYRILEKFYLKRNLNYKLVFEAFRSLQTPCLPSNWENSYNDIRDFKRSSMIDEIRQRTLRKFSSEITLRMRTLWL